MSNAISDILNRITNHLPNPAKSLSKRNAGNLVVSMKREMEGLIKVLDMHVCIHFFYFLCLLYFNQCSEAKYGPRIK